MKGRKEEDGQQCSGLKEVIKGKENGKRPLNLARDVSHLLKIELWLVSVRAK